MSVNSIQSECWRIFRPNLHWRLHHAGTDCHQRGWVFLTSFWNFNLETPCESIYKYLCLIQKTFALLTKCLIKHALLSIFRYSSKLKFVFFCHLHCFTGTTDVNPMGEQRLFLGYPHCRSSLNLIKGKTYLVMGASHDIYSDEKEGT